MVNRLNRSQPSEQPDDADAEAVEGFGQLLRQHRLSAGLTQEALAERAGVGVRSIQALERAEGRPRRDTAFRLATALQLADAAHASFVATVGPIPRRRSAVGTEVPVDVAAVRLVPWRMPLSTLPEPLTSFVGRERETAEVARLLSDTRLMTLTGPAGTGKSRLALQVARGIRTGFSDGVVFVPLAPVGEPTLMVPTIAAVLGVEQGSGQTLTAALTAYLRTKDLLLILDNFEQLVEAAPRVSQLLVACPSLRVLATSRIALHVSGEQEYAVPPLPVPDADARDLCDPATQLQSHAVALFVQRAQAVKPEFSLTAENASHIAEICRRLDGLPLAIELAAARIKLLPPALLLGRLTRRLDLLVGGPRDQAQRQRTMRGAIAWSYDLLDTMEQRLFRSLAIFNGGWTLEAAELVFTDDSGDVLNTLGSLLDKSLLRVRADPSGGTRYGMLETLREYALEQLQASGEGEVLAQRHAAYYLEWAEQGAPCPADAPRQTWLASMGAEQENLRAALQWALGRGKVDMATEFAIHLVSFWSKRGELSEARELLERLRSLDEGSNQLVSPELQVRALTALTAAVWHQGESARAHTLLEQCLALARSHTSPAVLIETIDRLGFVALVHGDYERVTTLQHEGMELAQQLGDLRATARALTRLSDVARARGEIEQIRVYCEEALALSHALGEFQTEGYTLNNLGFAALLEGDLQQAMARFTSSIALFREMDNVSGVAEVLCNVGRLARVQGNQEQALNTLAESLSLASQGGPETVVPDALEELACLATVQGQAARAARLFGAAQALRDARCLARWPTHQARYLRPVDDVRSLLGEEACVRAWAEGRAMSLNEVLAFALAVRPFSDG